MTPRNRRWRLALLSGIALLGFAGTCLAEPFVDISANSGMAMNGRNKGVAVADVDGDGVLDIFVSNKGGPSHLYLGKGDGTYRDVTEEAGLSETGYAMGSCFGDVNNDGKPDLYVVRGGRYEIEANRLYVNAGAPGKPSFKDVTATCGAGVKTFTYGATFFDYDKDGRLDLYCADYGVGQKNYLFRNVTTGPKPEDVKFEDVTDKAGVASEAWSWSAAAFDYDGDGWDDLYVSNGQYPGVGKNRLYKNMGDGTFKDVAAQAGVVNNAWTLGTGVGDWNNDGFLDMYVSNYVGGNRMFRNNGNGTFADVTKESGTAHNGWGKGTGFADTDHSGFLSMYEGDCKFSNQLYHNNGNGTFTDVVDKFPSMKLETIRTKGVAFADVDNDGDMDLLVMNWEVGPRIYRNDQNDKKFVKVRAEGTTFADAKRTGAKSSRDAVGAKVRLLDGSGKLLGFREVMTSNGFCSNPPLEVQFGVPAGSSFDVEVTFPSGLKVVKKGVAAGSSVVVKETE